MDLIPPNKANTQVSQLQLETKEISFCADVRARGVEDVRDRHQRSMDLVELCLEFSITELCAYAGPST